MAVAFARRPGRPPTPAFRPRCPRHPDSTVRLDGYFRQTWSNAHRRPRYRCVTVPGTRGHAFALPVSVRQPTEHHPDSGTACPHCEHEYDRHEGVKTGHDFIFGHQEIARLFLRLGEGMSLREASRQLRSSIFRVSSGGRSLKPKIRPGETSRQANLAINYLDAYAPAVIEALHPKEWPRVIVIDSTTLMTRGFRAGDDAGDDEADDEAERDETEEKQSGNLKAGTIMVAVDPGRPSVPCLIQVQGGKDVESWRAFFGTLAGAPEWVVADLDPAIARAVRETWPHAILYHSRHHLAELMRKRALADGIPARVKLDEPIQLARPLPWSPTRQTVRRYGKHPLLAAIDEAQRGPDEWAALLAAIEEHIPPDQLQLRSWIATNELLIKRQWEIARVHGRIPLSTGSLEGKIGEWLAPLRRRAGRWQNARRLNLVLGLITLHARGEAREARYAGLIRGHFAARHNRSHLPSENGLPAVVVDGRVRPMSWWRTWHDREQPSLPRLVHESSDRTRRRAADADVARHKARLEARYEQANDLRKRYGIPDPPSGRPKRPTGPRVNRSVRGKTIADFDDELLEWDWVFNGDLDPRTLPAGSKQRVVWRCCLNADHVWDGRVRDRTQTPSFCPFHMGNRVHPSESLASFYPWLAREWHPTKNELRADQVSRGSGRVITWRCQLLGHEWPAAVYQRTNSHTGCPECAKLEASARTKAGLKHSRVKREALVVDQLAELAVEAEANF